MIRGLLEGSVNVGDDSASCRVRFGADEPFFRGHFPGHPIVPGVMMVEVLVALARQWSGLGDVAAISEAKFRHEVAPNEEIVCTVRRSGGEFVADAQAAGQRVVEASFTLEEART